MLGEEGAKPNPSSSSVLHLRVQVSWELHGPEHRSSELNVQTPSASKTQSWEVIALQPSPKRLAPETLGMRHSLVKVKPNCVCKSVLSAAATIFAKGLEWLVWVLRWWEGPKWDGCRSTPAK